MPTSEVKIIQKMKKLPAVDIKTNNCLNGSHLFKAYEIGE